MHSQDSYTKVANARVAMNVDASESFIIFHIVMVACKYNKIILKHVMLILAKEESENTVFVASINAIQAPTAPQAPPPSTPASQTTTTIRSLTSLFPGSTTKVQLNSIL
jgi:hypothetical protein